MKTMKTTWAQFILFMIVVLGTAATCSSGQTENSSKTEGTSASSKAAKNSEKDESSGDAGVSTFDYDAIVLSDLRDTGNRLIELAKAMPADKFTWRPTGEGALSASELYLLAATEYYHLPSEFGAIQAAGYEYGGDAVTGRRQATVPLEKSTTNKAEVVTEIVDAVSYFNGIMQTLSDADLQKQIKVSGRDTTPNGILFIMANDMHEYLAEAMDYARSNGVTLPWMAEEQKQKQKRGERTPFR